MIRKKSPASLPKNTTRYFFHNNRIATNIVLLICFAFTLAGLLVSLNRYWQYEVFYFDFGIFDRAIWEVAHFKAPVVDHFIVGGKLIFADHFSPSIFLLSPLYWITNNSEVLLIAQAVIVGISGWVLYCIGRKVIKDDFLSISVLISYFLFVGLQNAVITDFHELTVMTLPLMLTFWAIVSGKKKLFFLFLLITLGCKEVTFALGIGIGVALLFIRKDWKTIALITIIISALWGFLTIKIVIPYFSHGIYVYAPSFPDAIFGKLYALIDNKIKQRTIFYSLFSFGFLPLFSPAFWFLILQDYALRFIPNNFYTRWNLGLHYNAQSAVILSVSSLYGLRRIIKIEKITRYKNSLGVLLIINAFILYRFVLHGPFLLASNQIFYKHTKDFVFLNTLIKKVPANATVMAQNNLAVRFDHQQVWTIESDPQRLQQEYYIQKKPQYIVLDTRQGQNPNDFFLVKDINYLLEKLKNDKNYIIYYHSGDQYIFKRKT